MRINKLTPIIVSLVVLAVITVILVRYRSVEAQQDRAAKAPISSKATLQQTTQGNGFTTSPATETRVDTDTDLYLDAAEVERRVREEQTTGAPTPGPIPISLGHVVLPLVGGMDHAVAGVGTRNSGEGVIRLRGVPPGSTLLFALLVWGEIAPPPVLNQYNVVFGPNCTVCAGPAPVVAGAPFGTALQPCWNPAGEFQGYIANVTNQIVPGINGDYQIRGLRTSIRDGRCPWGDAACAGPGNDLTLSEGASLIVVYANPCIPQQAQIYFHLGMKMFASDIEFCHRLPVPIRTSLLKHSRIGADGQVGVENCGLRAFSLPPLIQVSDERTWIENCAETCSIQIKGDGGLNRDSDWNGDDGEPLNKLWDTHTDVFTSTCLVGSTDYQVRYRANRDCIVPVVHILGVR